MLNSLLEENGTRMPKQTRDLKGLRAPNLVVWFVAALVLLAPACKKKRPSLPPQTQPPVLSPEPKGPTVDSLPPTTLPPAATTTPTPPEKPRTRRAHKPVTNSRPSASIPTKPPIPTPAKPTTPDPLGISPDVSRNASLAQRQSAEQLLASAENNIGRINRSLNEQEQSMRQQVNNFIQQSRRALQDGDVERGYNLALKASLLSSELTK